MADLDVDALVAELDDLLADQPAKRKPASGPAQTRSAFGAQPANTTTAKPNAAASFMPSSNTATATASRSATATATHKPNHNQSSYGGSTGTSAFDLSDSDDDAPQSRSKPTTAAAAKPASSSFAPSSSTAAAAARKPAAARASSGHDSDDDLNTLLSEMDSAIDRGAPQSSKPASSTSSKPRASPTGFGAGSSSSSGSSSLSSNYARPAAASSSSFGPRSKCYPTVLSSSDSSGGLSGAGCARLLCTSCDQPVIALRGQCWRDSVADYMFFRNYYPDATKLAPGLQRAPRTTAYACQCSWQSVGDEGSGGDSLNLSSLDVTDRSKKPGCSAWNSLRWICAGH